MKVSYRASAEEQRQTLPGDSMIPEPSASWTHAVTIASPNARVWQWIAQMGADQCRMVLVRLHR